MNELLFAPRYGGELYDIQQALYAYAGRSVNLRFPRSGDNRTAFIRYDLDGDSVKEAVAFYSSPTADGVAEVHINIIDQREGRWRSVYDTATGASDIHRVDISPLSQGGEPVIAVGAELYSATGNQLTLFTYSKDRLTTCMQDSYTEFMLCDLAGAGYKQLLTLNLNSTERTAKAHVYTVMGSKAKLMGTATLDGNISDFTSVKQGTLADGRAAVFIDSAKSTAATLTDAVYFEGERLVNPFFDSTLNETVSTLRVSTEMCRDINSDGITDIPFSEVLPGYEEKPADERRYLTVWRSFDGSKYLNTLVADFNYEGGYYFAFPDSWQGKVTFIYDDQNKMRSYRVWDSTLNTASQELLRIRVYTTDQYKTFEGGQLIELARTEGHVWAARLVATGGQFGIDAQQVLQSFNLL